MFLQRLSSNHFLLFADFLMYSFMMLDLSLYYFSISERTYFSIRIESISCFIFYFEIP